MSDVVQRIGPGDRAKVVLGVLEDDGVRIRLTELVAHDQVFELTGDAAGLDISVSGFSGTEFTLTAPDTEGAVRPGRRPTGRLAPAS